MRFIQHFFLIIVFCAFIASCKEKNEYQSVFKEIEVRLYDSISDDFFLGDKKCKECHQKEFKNWKGSHHDKAMEVANSETVLGNFKNITFESQGVTSRFFKKGKDFFVNTEGPDGNYHDYKIAYTCGVFPLQQYIVKFPNGRYQCLKTAWDSKVGKWFDLYPDFKIVHSEWLHWSRGGLNWNTMCADCHSTNVRKNYRRETDSYNTKYSLINVSCEACHGPGKQHVNDVARLGEDYVNSDTFLMTSNTSPKELVDQCARCHMRREQFSKAYDFKGTMLDHYFPQLIEEERYHADGQILDEVYVYGSFVQSKMYQNNISCTNCHNAHSLKLKFEGNALCAQCHEPQKYNAKTHHAHNINSEGAQCVNCHMPGNYYMGNDFRRDHSLRVPRPDLSLKYGTPNACTNCHNDKDDEWAWSSFKKLYGTVDSIHFSEKLIPGIQGEVNAHEGLLALIQDKKHPEIVRASAVKALEKYNTTIFIQQYIDLLEDDSPLVRATSIDVLSGINNRNYVSYFLPLLKDTKRTVRIKAFYGLSSLAKEEVPEVYKKDYDKVKKEFWNHVNSNYDFVGGRVKEANYYLKKGNVNKGIEGYENALKIDELNNSLRLTLANLYYQNNTFNKAESLFKKVIELEPEYGPVYYSLALLLAEQNRVEEAIEQLQKAKIKMPTNNRVYYNLSLLYNKKGDYKNAEKILYEGLKVAPNNESLLYTLAYQFYTTDNYKKSRTIIKRLIKLHPENPQYMRFLDELKTK
ncbi:tetratricopeptide repeat protein [Tenacibaculum sp. M341]|uniref:tetratricopeptide repeat protein n=1 Tax=Tenacibaculum sp. M341 TaxID=2530339 RepID=UPI00104E5D38|nr:tetratricopeptide repeat protein [Tenacibaculum sp. M341]TCI90396.1 tetratricopeptide repeat protein [Tenacibaculum sp. M341]